MTLEAARRKGIVVNAIQRAANISKAAAAITDKSKEVYGICLRGKPGWGENMAFLTAMANSYGARWFDENWQPQLDSATWASTLNDYLKLLNDHGPADASANGYNENLALFQEGKCAIWIDATVAASAITNPGHSKVAHSVGFALAPDRGLGKRSNWSAGLRRSSSGGAVTQQKVQLVYQPLIVLSFQPLFFRQLALDQFAHHLERERVTLKGGVGMSLADVLYGAAQNIRGGFIRVLEQLGADAIVLYQGFGSDSLAAHLQNQGKGQAQDNYGKQDCDEAQ